jgi:lycopene beta-cyclase
MYVMPLEKLSNGHYKVFFEETSLVGLNERMLTFSECKSRAMKRLAHYKISVLGLAEEEYCYIPMGGELPSLDQRIVAFGAAANIVHPSTGYQLCRMLAAASALSQTIGQGIHSSSTPDKIAKSSYLSLWNKKNRLQRDFQVFGGDFLMAQDVNNLRSFFTSFFNLPQSIWSGFLAGWPGLPHNHHHDSWEKRFSFALQLFMLMENKLRVNIILFAMKHTLVYGPNTLLRSILPPWLLYTGPPDNSEIIQSNGK